MSVVPFKRPPVAPKPIAGLAINVYAGGSFRASLVGALTDPQELAAVLAALDRCRAQVLDVQKQRGFA